MEPMTLGTPSNSGPSSPTTTPTGSPYLPSFLLGEVTSPHPNASTSPKVKRSAINESQIYSSPRYFSSQNGTPHGFPQAEHLISGEKVSGPPIRGLFDTISSPTPVNESKNQLNEANAYISSVARQLNNVTSPSMSSESTESSWVTIFGFPPAAASYILSQFASYGHIIAKKVPASGNWIHVHFSSRLEAKRALACNGKIFSGSVMIGVLPCRDQSVLADRSSERSLAETSTINLSMGPSSPKSLYPDLHRSVDASLYESPYASPRSSQARPLASRHEIFASGNTPQKSSGIMSKALELLGW